MGFINKIHLPISVNLKNQKIKHIFKRSFFASPCTFEDINTNQDNNKVESKILKVAMIGCPNVGKSTTINQVVGRRIFAMSKKVHTTKCCAKGIFNEGQSQIVFLDTPGLVSTKELEKYKLNSTYFKGGEDAILEADLIGVIHDVSNVYTREKLDPKVLRLLHLYKEKESILILNKVDTVKSKRLLLNLSKNLTKGESRTSAKNIQPEKLSEIDIQQIIKADTSWTNFSSIFMVSALLGTGIDDVRKYLLKVARPGKWIFEQAAYTDKDPVKIIEETVRSRLLENLPEEVPYRLDVQLEYLDMDNEELITAVVLVGYSADRTARLVAGIKGKRIQMIASEAEQEIADTFLSDVHLQLILKKKRKPNEVATFS